jgi:hypothetical protein
VSALALMFIGFGMVVAGATTGVLFLIEEMSSEVLHAASVLTLVGLSLVLWATRRD